ncbi:zinc finger protein 423 homolog [Macrosteles quadrilineatus]|uniref:zinc finger protein 423 homolog n=1 Tax=Macrosteles quadrilineatus TaxID=74068 RepID=UPI0023E0D255|nr:zinc finger protein 423 homolog [Macrosteles quadrilineatus]
MNHPPPSRGKRGKKILLPAISLRNPPYWTYFTAKLLHLLSPRREKRFQGVVIHHRGPGSTTESSNNGDKGRPGHHETSPRGEFIYPQDLLLDALGTEAGPSWGSEGHTSPPSSCYGVSMVSYGVFMLQTPWVPRQDPRGVLRGRPLPRAPVRVLLWYLMVFSCYRRPGYRGRILVGFRGADLSPELLRPGYRGRILVGFRGADLSPELLLWCFYDALGTEAGSSWGSEGQTSPPSSCATPNSASDVPDAELTFTVGVTEATPYACQFCDKAFPRLSYLKKHEQTHSEHMPFRCEFCSRLFKHKRSRDRHIKLHTGDKKYRCNQCDAAFSRSDHLKIHMKTHDNQKPFQCTICNRGYNTAAALTSHMQNHKKSCDGSSPSPSSTPGSTFKCLQCGEVFRKPEELQNHMVTHHNVEGGGGTPPVPPSPRRTPHYPHSPRLACMYCTKDNFNTMESLQLHVQAMHGSILNGEMHRELSLFSPQTSPSPSLLSHPLLSTPPSPTLPYSCQLCTMRFHSIPSLQKHALTVHGFRAKESSLFCVQCNLQFPTPALFAEHYVLFHGTAMGLFAQSVEQMKPTDLSLTKKTSRHSEERPSKRLRSENGISNGIDARRTPSGIHNQYDHPGSLLCNQCNAALPDFEAFRSHIKSHIDEAGGLLGGGEPRKAPPVVCPHCGAQLASQEELPQHLTSHFLATATEYGCQSCMKLFTKPDELQKHLMDIHAHHLYRCALCKEMFDSKVAIQVHFAVKHSNESKLFRCTACPSVAVYRSEMDFTLHVRTMHTPQHLASPKPPIVQAGMFRCLFCHLSFPSELEMQLHLPVHTKQFHCHLCQESFPVEFLLDKHLQTHHSAQVLNGAEEVDHKPSKGVKTSPSSHPSSNGNISDNKKQDSVNNNIVVSSCEICERSDFSSEAELAAHRKLLFDHLKIHMKTHDNQKPFQCTICNRGYNTAAALTSHMQNHKKSCDGSSPSPSSTPGSTFKCLQCGEVFRKPEELQNHMVTHHNVEGGGGTPPVPPSPRRTPHYPHSPRLACMYCTKDNFNTMESLQLHVQAMHGSILNGEMHRELSLFSPQTSPSPSLLSHPLLSTPPSPTLPYSCQLCTMRFHSIPSLQKHALTVHGFRAKESSLFCVQCNLQFPTPALFAEHYVLFHGTAMGLFAQSVEQMKPTDLSLTKKTSRHSEERPSKRLRSENGISNGIDARRTPSGIHNQYDHPGSLLCNQCNAALPDFEAFRSHIKSHIDEAGGLLGGGEPRKAPPVVCPHCGAQLASQEELPQHLTSHFLATATEYGCQSCMKLFTKPDELQKHLMDIHAHHLYRCALCKEMFDSKVAIQVHFAVKHSNESKLFRCTACPSVAVYRSEMDFTLHVRTMHTPQHLASPKPPIVQAGMFRCLFCHLSFPSELEMQLHLPVHTKQFHCHLCQESFPVEFLLDKHLQTHHSAQVLNGAEEVDHKPSKGVKTSPSSHPSSNGNISDNKKQDSVNNNIVVSSCEICERSDFSSEAELAAHRKLVHHVKSSSSSGKLSLHCAYCSESCKSRSDLENHMKSHSQGCVTQGKHKCNICDEMCSSAAVLAEHKLTHCKVINGTSCTQCKASITNEDLFYQHLRQHSNISPSSNGSPTNQLVLPTACVICRQTLVSDMEARIHARFHLNQSDASQCSVCLHANDRRDLVGGICKDCYHRHGKTSPTRCTECQLKFETVPALEAHMAAVHRKTYQCIKCQVSFETEKEIQQHVATHLMSEGGSGLECRLCMRVLGSPLQLQTHLIEHTFAGCPTFTCYICSAVFTAAHGLQAHMLEHGLAARPYDCPSCSQRFFFRAELDNHSFVHLDEENREDRQKGPPYFPFRTKMESANSSPQSSESPKDVSTEERRPKTAEYKCKICNKEFDNAVSLEAHNQQHHDSEKEILEEERNIKKEIKEEQVEEEEEEEQIDVGDHHSEDTARSECSVASETLHEQSNSS